MATPAQTGALGLAAGALLGLVVGLSIQRSASAPAEAPRLAAASAGAEAPASEGGAVTPAPASPGAPRGAASPAASPRATTRSAIAAAIAAVPRPEIPSGAGKIRGSVRTAEKAPVAGAKVTLTFQSERRAARSRSRAERPTSDGDAPPPIEESVRRLIEQEMLMRASKREALTDAAGAYAFEGLAEGKYLVGARAEGFKITRSDGGAVEPGAVVDFDAKAVGRVEATVILPDGRAPDRATISFKQGRRAEHRQWTPQDPVVEVDAGTYQVAAQSAGEDDESRDVASLESAPQRLEVVLGAPVRVLLELKGRPLIRGKVVFPPGESREGGGAGIYALRFVGNPPDPSELPQSPAVKRSWTSSAVGAMHYQIDGVEPGTYLVGLTRQTTRVLTSQIVEVADGPVTLDLAIPPVDRTKALHVTVLDGAGAKIPGFEVHLQFSFSNGGSSSSGAEMVRLDDGTALIFSLEDPDDLERSGGYRRRGRAAAPGQDDEEVTATVVLTIEAGEHGKKRVELAKGQRSGEVVVRFDAQATLDVSVQGYVGGPLEGKGSLLLQRAAATPEDRQHALLNDMIRGPDAGAIDAEGRATLGPVEAGPYDVVLVSQPGSGSWRYQRQEIARTPIELRGGKNSITIAVPPLHTLVVEAAAGTRVMIAPEGADGAWTNFASIGKSGKATFELIPAGRYKLHGAATDGTEGQMSVVVPAPGPVKFAPEEHDAILVHVTSADGTIAQMGFEEGDLIVAVDGVELENDQQMQMAFMAATGKESVTLTVLRGRGRVELNVDAKKLMMADRGGGGGGDMQPTKRPK